MRRLACVLAIVVVHASSIPSAEAQPEWVTVPSGSPTGDPQVYGLGPGKSSDFLSRLFPGFRPGYRGAGWYVIPSLSLTEEYDDNVFGVSTGKQSDFITRVTPGLTVGYEAPLLSLLGSVSIDAEFFAERSELDGVNGKRAGLVFRHVPDPRLTLGLGASYAETEDTKDLLRATGVSGVDIGRVKTRAFVVTPTVFYQLTSRTSTEVGYSFTRTEISGGATDMEHEPTLALLHQLTPLDGVSLRYRFRYFDSDAADSTRSHAVTVGWTRRLAERTFLTLEAGPLISDGHVDGEGRARLTHRFQLVTASLEYARGQTTVIGRSGASIADTVIGTLSYAPTAALGLGLSGTFERFSEGELGLPDTRRYTANASASYRVIEWAAVRVSYTYSLQEGGGSGTIRNHVASINLDFALPIRVY